MDDGKRPDPVQWAADEDIDLYDVATWEERTPLDSLSRTVYRGLKAGGRGLVISVALLIALGQVAVTGAAMLQDPVIGVYIVGSIVPAIIIAFFVWRSDVTLAQPLDSLAITFLLGVIFASFAAVANSSLEGPFAALGPIGLVLFFYLVVAPVEETVKLLAVRMYSYRQSEFAAVVDGAVYGAVAGLGFAAIENTVYITQQYLQTAVVGNETALISTFQTAAVRTFAGPGHVIYSAIAGYYLGLAKFNPRDSGPIVVKGLLIAAFVHGTYNVLVSNLALGVEFLAPVVTIPPAIAFITFVVVFDAVVLLVLVVKLQRYGRAFRATSAAAFYGTFDEEPTGEGSKAESATEKGPTKDSTSEEGPTGNSAGEESPASEATDTDDWIDSATTDDDSTDDTSPDDRE